MIMINEEERKSLKDSTELEIKLRRYKQAINQIEEIVTKIKGDLNNEEKDLLKDAFYNYFIGLRSNLEDLLNLEEKEIFNKNVFEKIRNEIKNEIIETCNKFIKLCDNFLLQRQLDKVSKTLYTKLKADYYRYLTICYEEGETKNLMIKESLNYYQEAEKLSKDLDEDDPLILRIAINFSKFYVEVKGDYKKGISIAKDAFDNGMKKENSKNVSDGRQKEHSLCRDILQKNIEAWTETMPKEEEE